MGMMCIFEELYGFVVDFFLYKTLVLIFLLNIFSLIKYILKYLELSRLSSNSTNPKLFMYD
jgi:hypothetical protein